MNFTSEQLAIFNTNYNVKINAVAGSGKTTTIIEYAKTRPKNCSILYLAFNKVVKEEALKRFKEIGLQNVTVETAHSLAYKSVIFNYNYKVKSKDYKVNEVVEILGLTNSGEKHSQYILANHILKFVSFFCNSNVKKVQELDYRTTITDLNVRTFVDTHYEYIELKTRAFLAKMNSGEIEITHDFYLKKFHLSNPQLYFDYILFDEAQDASAAMLDVFLKQNAIKVIVGDTHQQIYGWRYAVNSLDKADFENFHLSTSFRFNQNIAKLAVEILNFKDKLIEFKNVDIKGNGNQKTKTSKAIIARSNLGLLLAAIEYITQTKYIENIYFEGNINSYTYADDGTSLYDVLNLFLNKKHLIKDSLIKLMKDIDELKEYIDKTEDSQLGMMLEIVEKYEDDVYHLIKNLKDKHLTDTNKENADVIFSTVHRCKGMEYDEVVLVDDFITEAKIEKISESDDTEIQKAIEEINLLYVAVTRAKTELHIPEKLLPKNFSISNSIKIIKRQFDSDVSKFKTNSNKRKYFKSKFEPNNSDLNYLDNDFSFKVKNAVKLSSQNQSNKNLSWNTYLDNELKFMFNNGVAINEIAKHFGKSNGLIYNQLRKLGVVKKIC